MQGNNFQKRIRFLQLGAIITVFPLIPGLFTTSTGAHQPGESYIFLQTSETSLTGRIEITLNDLGLVLPLDSNNDGTVSEEEFNAQEKKIYDFLQPHLIFWIDEGAHSIQITDHDFRKVSFGTYALIRFSVSIAPLVPDKLDIEHHGFMEAIRPSHTVYVIIEENARTGLKGNEGGISLFFENAEGRETISFQGESALSAFWRFIKLGVYHILVGFDHLAFLFALLLPAVLVVREDKWEPAKEFKDVFLKVLGIVTTFTVAHSITLSLAAFGWVDLPAKYVEALIALSIAVVATGNVVGPTRSWIWPAIFCLGLLHGLGFAYVLAPYGVAENSIVFSLLGFNVGVEIGQIALIVICLPFLYFLRKWHHFVFIVVRCGSVALIGIATFWFAERGLKVLNSVFVWMAQFLKL